MVYFQEIGNVIRNHSTNHTRLDAGRCCAGLASQSTMGLRPQRRSWAGVGNTAYSISDGQNIGLSPHMPAGTRRTLK